MRYKANTSFVSSNLDGEEMIMHTETGEYFGLNEVGQLVWKELCKHPVTLDSLIEMIYLEYEVDKKQVRADVLQLLDELMASGLLDTLD